MKFIYILFILLLSLNASEVKQITVKEHCVISTEHHDADIDQLKMLLMEQVKRDAIEELFGTMLKSDTLIVDGKLVSDKIKQVAVGNVRIKGTPKFYNGKTFGEVCTKAEAYITKKDYQKYQPQTVSKKQFCYNNPDVALKLLKQEANFAAYKNAITKFKPNLKNITNQQAESYIHGFEKSNEQLNIQTGVLCFDFSATLYPYELELGSKNNNATKESKKKNFSQKNGLIATFYSNTDYAFKHPIYSTTITQDISLFKKSFVNNNLQKDKAYYIRLQGFYYSNIDKYQNFELKSDVYHVEVKINNKRVVNKNETRGGVGIKAGYNPIEILITSSNAYDIKLLEKQDDGSFIPVSLNELFIKE